MLAWRSRRSRLLEELVRLFGGGAVPDERLGAAVTLRKHLVSLHEQHSHCSLPHSDLRWRICETLVALAWAAASLLLHAILRIEAVSKLVCRESVGHC